MTARMPERFGGALLSKDDVNRTKRKSEPYLSFLLPACDDMGMIVTFSYT